MANNIYTVEEATQKYCPFSENCERKCMANKCMAWIVEHSYVSREDHSGARDCINKYALETNRIMKRKGPSGSTGYIYLEEVGYCGRIKQ